MKSSPEIKIIVFLAIVIGITLIAKVFYPQLITSELATLLVGGFAIYLYLKQKEDHKRNAAKLILQEIRYAEQQIKNAKRSLVYDYYLANKLLPTNSWHKNIHLFVKDLRETEMDIVSRFYSSAAYLDILINKISDLRNQNYFLIKLPADIKEQKKQLKQLAQEGKLPPSTRLIRGDDNQTSKLLNDVSRNIELIYDKTSVVSKLRKISERKWYQIF